MPIDFAAAGLISLCRPPTSASRACRVLVRLCQACTARWRSEGCARSLSLDLLDQMKGFEKNGQFRYTPPTHAMLAFDQALRELELEGGIGARSERYRRNHETLLAGMRRLGFRPCARSRRPEPRHHRLPLSGRGGSTFPPSTANSASVDSLSTRAN